jgi:hypothetical protein
MLQESLPFLAWRELEEPYDRLQQDIGIPSSRFAPARKSAQIISGQYPRDEETLKAELYQQIGQLQAELDWLKKSPAYRVRAEARMDFRIRRTERTAAVPLDGDFAVGVVLRSGTRDGREF